MSETGDIHSTLYDNESPTGLDILAGRIREARDVKGGISAGEATRHQIVEAVELARMKTQGKEIAKRLSPDVVNKIKKDMGRREGYRRDEDKELRGIKETPPDERLR